MTREKSLENVITASGAQFASTEIVAIAQLAARLADVEKRLAELEKKVG